jgi:Cu+-exporting ATPase
MKGSSSIVTKGSMVIVRDPVCGMQINESEAVGKVEFGGMVYHFCSPFCRAAFIEEPDKFVPTKNDANPESHHHKN